VIVSQIEDIQTGIAELETQVLAWHKNNPVSQRLATIPGIGPIIATAIAVSKIVLMLHSSHAARGLSEHPSQSAPTPPLSGPTSAR
jgi:transposase